MLGLTSASMWCRRASFPKGGASICEYLVQKIGCLHFQEAPVEWLLSLNRHRGLLSLCLWGFLYIAVAFEPFMDWACLALDGQCTIERTTSWDLWHVVLGICQITLAIGLSYLQLSPRVFEALLCFVHVAGVTASTFTLGSPWQYVIYAGAGLPFLSFCLALSGIRVLPFVVSVALEVPVCILHMWLSGWLRRPPFGLLVGFLCSFSVLIAQHIQWNALYESEQTVKAEKEALEALLSTVCDAGCWVAADGDTVLRGDRRLDDIMGVEMEGTQLSKCLDREDRERLQFATTGTTTKALQDLVRLLPVTFRRQSATTVDFDLFIVDRRGVFASTMTPVDASAKEEASRLGFLIGFRTVIRQGMNAQLPDLEEGGLELELTETLVDLPCDVASFTGIATSVSQLSLDPPTPIGHRPNSIVSASAASVPATLLSVKLQAPEMYRCTKRELEAALQTGADHVGFSIAARPHARATALEALGLVCDHARGGALLCIASAAAFAQVFGLAECTGEQQQPKPGLRVADKQYMTNRLRGVHISEPCFAQAFREFTEHSDDDRWPEDHPDAWARGQPKDGAFLVSTSGFRLKCAVKLLGLPPPMHWDSVGTKHETAMACAWAVKGAQVFVRSDAGTIHYLVRNGDTLHVCKLEPERSEV